MATNQNKGIKLNDENAVWTAAENVVNNPVQLEKYDPDGTVAKMANDLQNYKKFSYDFNADPLYQNYKDQYVRGGKLAMLDTTANAAALSGGYGNSYAVTAGNQAYQQYLSQLNNVIPELYNAAYTRYNDDRSNARANYEMMKGLADDAYSRSKDAVSMWQDNRDYLTNLGVNVRDYNRNVFTSDRDYDRNVLVSDRDYTYQTEQDKIANALKQATLDETIRSNKASEKLSQDSLNETIRSNKASEAAAASKVSSTKSSIPSTVTNKLESMYEDATDEEISNYLTRQYNAGVITESQMYQLYEAYGKNDGSPTEAKITTWEEFVNATGYSGIKDEKEFKRGAGTGYSDYDSYGGDYQRYLDAMYKKYKK